MFVVDGQQVGLVRPDVMKELVNYPQVIGNPPTNIIPAVDRFQSNPFVCMFSAGVPSKSRICTTESSVQGLRGEKRARGGGT